LFGLEVGLHRFIGLAGEPCHVWVQALEPQAEFSDAEWAVLPNPPTPQAARGQPMREITVSNDHVTVTGEDCDAPWSELGARLSEAACVRLISALQHNGHNCRWDEYEKLWAWENPLSVLAKPDEKEDK
jgi:hypothetical protein